MRVALTGTPGTGKTTVAERLDVPVVHLNDVIREHDLWTERDAERDSLVVDLDALADWVDEHEPDGTVVVESHLAYLLGADRVVVLRCHPQELEHRLRERQECGEGAGEDGEALPPTVDREVQENAESEALDVVLTEAVERHGRENVYEIDTTGRSPDDVADDVRAVVEGEREPSAGTVDFLEYL